MYIELDLGTVPPTATLREPEDFQRFEVVADRPSHLFVDPADLRRLAGARGEDPDWRQKLDGMIAFAESAGWVDESGAVRAHLTWRE